MTLLEIALFESKHRIELSASLETLLTEVESRFVVLPITGRICVRASFQPSTLKIRRTESSQPRRWSKGFR
jgi:hypothetical protein